MNTSSTHTQIKNYISELSQIRDEYERNISKATDAINRMKDLQFRFSGMKI